MLSYYISQSNHYTFRIEPATTNDYTMSLQNMTTLVNTTASLTSASYNEYESMLAVTASIADAQVGAEYRAFLINKISGSATYSDVWHGSVQVYASQSVDKSVYENQIPPITSHTSENRYIIMD